MQHNVNQQNTNVSECLKWYSYFMFQELLCFSLYISKAGIFKQLFLVQTHLISVYSIAIAPDYTCYYAW